MCCDTQATMGPIRVDVNRPFVWPWPCCCRRVVVVVVGGKTILSQVQARERADV